MVNSRCLCGRVTAELARQSFQVFNCRCGLCQEVHGVRHLLRGADRPEAETRGPLIDDGLPAGEQPDSHNGWEIHGGTESKLGTGLHGVR